MEDEVKKLSDSAVHMKDKFDTSDDAVKAKISKDWPLIFTTPEVILNDKSWLDVFCNWMSCGISVVDEAHCIKKWYVSEKMICCMYNT